MQDPLRFVGVFRASRALLLIALALLGACHAPESVPTISGAWSPATPPGASAAAAYMQIRSPRADVLLGATSSVAATVEMHTSVEEGGVTRMRPLESVELRPGAPYSFVPGGAHFMLMGLHAPLQPDSTYSMTLRFRDAGDVTIKVTVTAPGVGPPAD